MNKIFFQYINNFNNYNYDIFFYNTIKKILIIMSFIKFFFIIIKKLNLITSENIALNNTTEIELFNRFDDNLNNRKPKTTLTILDLFEEYKKCIKDMNRCFINNDCNNIKNENIKNQTEQEAIKMTNNMITLFEEIKNKFRDLNINSEQNLNNIINNLNNIKNNKNKNDELNKIQSKITSIEEQINKIKKQINNKINQLTTNLNNINNKLIDEVHEKFIKEINTKYYIFISELQQLINLNKEEKYKKTKLIYKEKIIHIEHGITSILLSIIIFGFLNNLIINFFSKYIIFININNNIIKNIIFIIIIIINLIKKKSILFFFIKYFFQNDIYKYLKKIFLNLLFNLDTSIKL
jgi:hypothetical protein